MDIANQFAHSHRTTICLKLKRNKMRLVMSMVEGDILLVDFWFVDVEKVVELQRKPTD